MRSHRPAQLGRLARRSPSPGVPVPGRGQDVQRVGVRAGVRDADDHQQVERIGLRVVDLHDPVAVVVEHARVEQLELGVVLAPASVLLDELTVRERSLRVVVAPAVPGVAGQRVEVPPVLLGVLAVIALVAGEAEDPLLEDRVAPVPERESQTEALLHVGEAGQPVLAPAVGARAGVVVRQVLPGGAVRAVVLANGAPLALTEVRPPLVPVTRLAEPVLQMPKALDAAALSAHGSHRLYPLVQAPISALDSVGLWNLRGRNE